MHATFFNDSGGNPFKALITTLATDLGLGNTAVIICYITVVTTILVAINGLFLFIEQIMNDGTNETQEQGRTTPDSSSTKTETINTSSVVAKEHTAVVPTRQTKPTNESTSDNRIGEQQNKIHAINRTCEQPTLETVDQRSPTPLQDRSAPNLDNYTNSSERPALGSSTTNLDSFPRSGNNDPNDQELRKSIEPVEANNDQTSQPSPTIIMKLTHPLSTYTGYEPTLPKNMSRRLSRTTMQHSSSFDDLTTYNRRLERLRQRPRVKYKLFSSTNLVNF